jgi:GNAT superfamily N-acetyltransferase
MAHLDRYTTTPSEEIFEQIIGMAMEYVTDLSLGGIAPSNPLHKVHQCVIGIEMATYLSTMGTSPERKTEVIVAMDDEKHDFVSGFLLYLPLRFTAGACGISYMAVHDSYRGKGIGREMVAKMLALYPHAELSCFVEKVPLYEALGFQVIGARLTQVRMNTQSQSADDVMAVLDTTKMMSHPAVEEQYQHQLQRVGQREMKQAQAQHDRNCSRREHKAAVFVRARGIQVP